MNQNTLAFVGGTAAIVVLLFFWFVVGIHIVINRGTDTGVILGKNEDGLIIKYHRLNLRSDVEASVSTRYCVARDLFDTVPVRQEVSIEYVEYLAPGIFTCGDYPMVVAVTFL